ncbi:alpha/beta hydrolase family protein [candidate division KSB1 bacterium]
MLIKHLNRQAYSFLDKRDAEIAGLKTKEDWIRRQKKVKDIFMDITGPFPEKTPLNPRVTGIIQKDGFKIEKIIYESIPDYYVSGCLFVPDGGKSKKPAIIYVSGHSDLAFRSDAYQRVIFNLVKKGFVVFAIDPIGQGERLQYYDEAEKKSVIGGPVREHSYVGNQCLLNGVSLARYFIWDGVRAVDYLLTRNEVDRERIGITGRSGGGTQTAYIAAFDERIKAAAPENYITSHRRLIESRGVQDAEQNFYHWLVSGAAIEDLLVARIPKPTLMVTTSRDMFSIQGAKEVFGMTMRAYEVFGKKDNFGMTEDDAGHESTKKNREAVYAFFQRHLNLPGNSADEEIELMKPEELHVTETGQVLTSIGGESTFSLNKKETQKLMGKIEESRKKGKIHLDKVRKEARKLSGYVEPSRDGKVVFRGNYQRNGYSVGMYAIEGEGNYVIPLLLMVPDGGGKYPAVIYIHPEGKSANASVGGGMENLVRSGFIVAAPDIIGTGETKGMTTYPGRYGYGSMIIGRSIVGIQAGDIARVVNFLTERGDVKDDLICAAAFDELCPALLHAAVFEPSISKSAFISPPVSYRAIAMNRFYEYNISFEWGVAGALTAYDLPDLAACIAPRKLLFVGAKDNMKETAQASLFNREYGFTRSVYSKMNASDNMKVLETMYDEDRDELIEWWLE